MSPGMAGLRRWKEGGAPEAIHPISLEDLHLGSVNVVLRISVQVRTWVRSCLAGITDGRSAVCKGGRSWPLLTRGSCIYAVAETAVSVKKASSCENGPCGRLWGWWLCGGCASNLGLQTCTVWYCSPLSPFFLPDLPEAWIYSLRSLFFDRLSKLRG